MKPAFLKIKPQQADAAIFKAFFLPLSIMAVGFTPRHTETVALGNLTKEQFWALAHDAALSLNWRIDYTSAAGFIAQTGGGAFRPNAEVKLLLTGEEPVLESASTGSEMMDLGRNKKTVKLLLDTMQHLAQNTFPHDLQRIYEKQAPLFPPAESDILQQAPPTKTEAAKDALRLFVPSKDYFFTPILVLLNIALFIAMVCTGVNIVDPDAPSLILWGANYSPLTLGGQPWRLLTCCFLHIGVMHLLLNMYALVFIGMLLEPYLGKTRFLAAYLLTGVAASVASLWWHDITLSAGASGAIFGLYGVFLALLTTNFIDKATRGPLLSSIGIFVVFNLFNGLKGGVDNAAHIGGLISGIVIGYALVPSLKKPFANGLKWGSLALVTLLLLGASFVLYKQVPAGMTIYEQNMDNFGKGEERALGYYKLPADASPADRAAELQNVGIPAWAETIKSLQELDAAGLPPELHTKVQGMLEYCQLRKRTYELIYKSIVENTDSYDSQIEELDGKVDQKIKTLSGSE